MITKLEKKIVDIAILNVIRFAIFIELFAY